MLYGSYKWNISYIMWSNLRSLHHGVSRSFSRKKFDICPETGKMIYSSIK